VYLQPSWSITVVFLPGGNNLMDATSLQDDMKALSASPLWPVHADQSYQISNSTGIMNCCIAVPLGVVKTLNIFGRFDDCPSIHPLINPWTENYFIGAVEPVIHVMEKWGMKVTYFLYVPPETLSRYHLLLLPQHTFPCNGFYHSIMPAYQLFILVSFLP